MMASTEDIIRGLPVDFVRRMRNWARVSVGAGPSHLRAVDYDAIYGNGYRETTEPLLAGEASDTQVALMRVAPRYRQAVEWFWTWEGQSLRWFGRRRGVDYHTFAAWVATGHELLQAELRARSLVMASAAESTRAAIAARSALITS